MARMTRQMNLRMAIIRAMMVARILPRVFTCSLRRASVTVMSAGGWAGHQF